MCTLLEPNAEYLQQNADYIRELYEAGEIDKKALEQKIALRSDLDTYLHSLKQLDTDDIGLHIYWFVCGDQYIGTLRLNERLTEKLRRHGGNIGYTIRPSKRGQGHGSSMLCFGLEKARELGMSEILIDCREDNVASRKIIEANGGIFDRRIVINEGEPASLHYKITL